MDRREVSSNLPLSRGACLAYSEYTLNHLSRVLYAQVTVSNLDSMHKKVASLFGVAEPFKQVRTTHPVDRSGPARHRMRYVLLDHSRWYSLPMVVRARRNSAPGTER